MKKVVCLLIALLLCASLACPVFAATDTFVPSISEKDHPEIVLTEDGNPAVLRDDEGNIVDELEEDCIVITPVSEAETSDEIPQEAKETLLEIYEKLTDGSMKLPYRDTDTDWVIRDLFDISLLCEDHPEMLEEGADLVVTFDLGIGEHGIVDVMVYSKGQWHPAVRTVNNGDGTVTVTLDHVGAVAISVPAGEAPKTGDDAHVTLWTVLMIASAATLVAVVVFRRKEAR